jgi:hypothetical protein
VNGWERYQIDLPEVADQIPSLALFDVLADIDSNRDSLVTQAELQHASENSLISEIQRVNLSVAVSPAREASMARLVDAIQNESRLEFGAWKLPKNADDAQLRGSGLWSFNLDYVQCMQGLTPADDRQRWAKCLWTRSYESLEDSDRDTDWRYLRTEIGDLEENIPGLLVLQHPEIFTPKVHIPNCLLREAACVRQAKTGAVLEQKWKDLDTKVREKLTRLLHYDVDKWNRRDLPTSDSFDNLKPEAHRFIMTDLALDRDEFNLWQQDWGLDLNDLQSKDWSDLDKNQRESLETLTFDKKAWQKQESKPKTFFKPWVTHHTEIFSSENGKI